MYLAWFDGDRKKPVRQKIEEARERYAAKFGRQPAVCLVNPEDTIEDSAVPLRPTPFIGRHCFWIGFDDVESATDRQEVQTPVPAAAEPAPAVAARPAEDAPPRPAKRATRARVVKPVEPLPAATAAPTPKRAAKRSTSGEVEVTVAPAGRIAKPVVAPPDTKVSPRSRRGQRATVTPAPDAPQLAPRDRGAKGTSEVPHRTGDGGTPPGTRSRRRERTAA